MLIGTPKSVVPDLWSSGLWMCLQISSSAGKALNYFTRVEGVSDRTTARRAVSGTCWLCQVWLWVLKMKGGPHSPAFGSTKNIQPHQLSPVISLKCSLQRSELLSGCVFIYQGPWSLHQTNIHSLHNPAEPLIFCNEISHRPGLKLTSKIPTNLPNVPFTPA